MQRRLCYISRCYRNAESAGSKAKSDYETVLRSMGAVNLGLPISFHNNKVVAFLLNLIGIGLLVLRLRKGDILFLQYPVKKYFVFLCQFARFRKASSIVFIHDLGSFRRGKVKVPKEIKKLMNADYLIAANTAMRSWLLDHGYSHPVGAMGFHDYLADSSPKDSPSLEPTNITVAYAGGLAKRKNSFLEKLSHQSFSYKLLLYGNNKDLELCDNKNIIRHPFMKDTDFIEKVQANFGLIWDGDSLDECSGPWGEYLKYNSPHKASFYIRAGLPLIIWRCAALAPLVEEEGIGILIDSLQELDHILKDMTSERYEKMIENISRVNAQISNGQCLKNALLKAMESFNQPEKTVY